MKLSPPTTSKFLQAWRFCVSSQGEPPDTHTLPYTPTLSPCKPSHPAPHTLYPSSRERRRAEPATHAQRGRNAGATHAQCGRKPFLWVVNQTFLLFSKWVRSNYMKYDFKVCGSTLAMERARVGLMALKMPMLTSILCYHGISLYFFFSMPKVGTGSEAIFIITVAIFLWSRCFLPVKNTSQINPKSRICYWLDFSQ